MTFPHEVIRQESRCFVALCGRLCKNCIGRAERFDPMTLPKARHRLDIILQHEPSWIGEAVSSLCLFLWAFMMLISDDYIWNSEAYLLPIFCLLLSPYRGWGLLSFSSVARSFAACLSCWLWGMLAYGAFSKWGPIGGAGVYSGMAIGEAIYVLKFARRDRYFTATENAIADKA